MCGILGLINTPWSGSAESALSCLASRGPDHAGTATVGEAVLGHTRLSVIDVSSGAHQPMHSPDGRYSIVFNGEIYNYRELRRELVDAGYSFTSSSDTEVLLHGYRRWGSALVARLNGIFAFAVWDNAQKVLFAARDRIGVKPFFYSAAHGLSFASTLAPFFRLEGFPRRLDYQALRDYLAFQTVLAPHTFLDEVRQLPPACWLSYDLATREVRVEQYWEIPHAERCDASPEELVEAFDEVLAASVKRQVVSDVPLGAFLSGGIDSSLVVHYMAQAGVRPLKTFSMRFKEGSFDETEHALAVSRRYGTEHHVIEAPQIGADRLLAAVGALDQPLADPAYVMTHELSRQTRRHVTVSLSGDGGDELFGGYARFRHQESDYPPKLWKKVLKPLVEGGVLPGSMLRRTLTGKELLFYRKVELGPYRVSRKSLHAYLGEEGWRRCHPEGTMARWKELLAEFGDTIDTGSLMRADLWSYLSENCLMKTDRASMAHGLEVRVPLLDNEVLDRALRLPSECHFRGGKKAILTGLSRRHLPEQVWNRPKHGFSVPLENNFNGLWKEVCSDYVARTSTLAPFLEEKAVQRLWGEALQGKGSRRLAYTFVVLLMWLEKNSMSF